MNMIMMKVLVLNGKPAGTHMLKNAILKFCGFKPVDTLYITRVRFKTKDQLQKELDKVYAKANQLSDKR